MSRASLALMAARNSHFRVIPWPRFNLHYQMKAYEIATEGHGKAPNRSASPEGPTRGAKELSQLACMGLAIDRQLVENSCRFMG